MREVLFLAQNADLHALKWVPRRFLRDGGHAVLVRWWVRQLREHLVDQDFAAAFDAPPIKLFGPRMVERDGFKHFLKGWLECNLASTLRNVLTSTTACSRLVLLDPIYNGLWEFQLIRLC